MVLHVALVKPVSVLRFVGAGNCVIEKVATLQAYSYIRDLYVCPSVRGICTSAASQQHLCIQAVGISTSHYQ